MIAVDAAGSGPPLVLLHGVGASRVVWRRAMPWLAARRHVVAPDLPGLGDSPPAGPGFDLDAVADALAGGLAAHTGAPFDLLGNSLGGAVAIALALRHPDAVRRLVLSAPAGIARYPPALARAGGVLGARLIDGRRLAGPPLTASPRGRRLLLGAAIADPARMTAGDARTMVAASRGSSRVADAIASAMTADLRGRLADLAMPWGVLWGERDRVVQVSALRTIRSLAPHVPVRTLPGVGHVPQMECPRRFAATVEAILDDLGAVTAR